MVFLFILSHFAGGGEPTENVGHASIGTHLNRGRTEADFTYFATVAAFLLRLLLPSSTHLQPPLLVGCATRSVVCNGGGWG